MVIALARPKPKTSHALVSSRFLSQKELDPPAWFRSRISDVAMQQRQVTPDLPIWVVLLAFAIFLAKSIWVHYEGIANC